MVLSRHERRSKHQDRGKRRSSIKPRVEIYLAAHLEANLKLERQTNNKLAAQRNSEKAERRVLAELKRPEQRIVDAGLMHDELKIPAKSLKVGFNLENRECFFQKNLQTHFDQIKSVQFNKTS